MRTLLLLLQASISTLAAGQLTDWHRLDVNNRMDDQQGVLLVATSSEHYPGGFGQRRPALVVRCIAKKVDVYLDARTQLQPEHDAGHGKRTIRIKLDDEKPIKIVGNESTSGDAVFFTSAADWVRRLGVAQLALVEVTPFRYAPATIGFNIAGLTAFNDDVSKHCGISLTKGRTPPPKG